MTVRQLIERLQELDGDTPVAPVLVIDAAYRDGERPHLGRLKSDTVTASTHTR